MADGHMHIIAGLLQIELTILLTVAGKVLLTFRMDGGYQEPGGARSVRI